MPGARSASNRLSARPSPVTRQAATGPTKPLRWQLPRSSELEQVAQEPPRALGHDHRAGLGQLLQPGGKVGRLAGHRLLLRCAVPDEMADDDEAGGDPYPGRERLSLPGPEPADRRRGREPGPDRTLGASSYARGQPKKASTPSPMCLATWPPKRLTSD